MHIQYTLYYVIEKYYLVGYSQTQHSIRGEHVPLQHGPTSEKISCLVLAGWLAEANNPLKGDAFKETKKKTNKMKNY